MTAFEDAPGVHEHGYFERSAEVDGRSEMRCVLATQRGKLAWTHVRQLDPVGDPSFEFATDFELDGHELDDRQGERLLDTYDRRVDGTARPVSKRSRTA